MKKILILAILLLGVSTASAQMTAPGYGPGGYGYNITPYGWGGMMGGYGPYGYAGNATPYGPYGYYEPGFGMMGPGMMGGGMGGMMGGYGMGGMMGGYGYAPGFGTSWAGYGSGINSLSWVAVTILVAAVAYLLGKRRTSGG